MTWILLAAGGIGAVNSSLNGNYRLAVAIAAATTGAVLAVRVAGGI